MKVNRFMRILMIAPLCPLPLEKGGAIRIWNIAKQLAQHHTVDLLCFVRSQSEFAFEDELKKIFRNVHFVVRREIISPRILLDNGIKKLSFFTKNVGLVKGSLFSNRPLLSVLYDHPDILRYIQLADDEREYDVFFAETYYGISALSEHLCELKTPLLLCEQNIEYSTYARQLDTQSSWLIRQLMQIDVWKMRQEEVRYWKQAGLIAGLSKVDVEEMREETNREDILMLENGVDVTWFSEKIAERSDNELLFVGNFSYFPNVDALKWLIEEIWPSIIQNSKFKAQNLFLRIVGRGADQSLKQFVQSHDLKIDESVEDIRSAFQQATALLAPLRAGSGTKYKVLEAMASHCPVITTSIGAEGLAVEDGREMIIADTAAHIGEQVGTLLTDLPLRQRCAENGYAFVKDRYDWPSIIDQFEHKLKEKLPAYV